MAMKQYSEKRCLYVVLIQPNFCLSSDQRYTKIRNQDYITDIELFFLESTYAQSLIPKVMSICAVIC